MTPAAVVAALGLAVAAALDYRTGRIPNWLTFSMIALGLVMGVAEGDWRAPVMGLVGATAIHYPLWMLQIEKAGDAKLLMGVGALLHLSMLIETSAWFAALYVPVGVAILAAEKKLGNFVAAARWTLDKAQGKPVGERPPATTLRTAPVIAAAAAAAAATPWLDLW